MELRWFGGRQAVAFMIGAVVLTTVAITEYCRAATPEFPFERDLVLDAPVMQPAKRKPSISVAPNGAATIDLWCKAVRGQVELSDTAIKIVPDALPAELPQTMLRGQCTPERRQADEALLDALSQMSGWRRNGDAVVLTGPKTLRFFLSTN